MLLLFWKVLVRLLSWPFSACEAGFEAFLEMGTSEGKVPQSSLCEERNLAASFGSHENQLRLTNIRGPIQLLEYPILPSVLVRHEKRHPPRV